MPRRAAAVALLLAVAVGCTPDPARQAPAPDPEPVIAGGGTTGIYYGYGRDLARVLTRETGTPHRVRETAGSVENLRLIADGRAVVGLVAADAAIDAVTGTGPFDSPLPVRALARVYDDVVHLVTTRTSGIASIDQLAGRRVSLGGPGSGTELIARRLLAAARVAEDALQDAGLGIDASIAALQDGSIDAFFWSGGLPTPGVAALARRTPIRLVPLGDLVDGVRAADGTAYREAIVPQGTYGLAESTSTMAVPNLLMAHERTDPVHVERVLELLFDHRFELARITPAVRLLDERTAIYTAAVPLHEGALRYYREEKGVPVDGGGSSA